MRISERTRDGYGTAVAGAVVGGTLLIAAAYVFIYLWVQTTDPDYYDGGEVLLLVPLSAAGMWLGSLLGCWVALRSRGHTGAGRTAGLLAPLMLAGAVSSTALFFSPLNGVAPAVMYFVILVVVPAGAALLARYLALRR